jgi:hypothetical protein
MNVDERKNKLKDLINLAMDCMGGATSIIDTKGTLLYYNQQSARILDRKPEYSEQICTHIIKRPAATKSWI